MSKTIELHLPGEEFPVEVPEAPAVGDVILASDGASYRVTVRRWKYDGGHTICYIEWGLCRVSDGVQW